MKYCVSNPFVFTGTGLQRIICGISNIFRQRALLFMTAILGVSLVIAGCDDEENARNEEDSSSQKEPFKLKIGLVLPKTGSLEAYGSPTFNGASLAVEHLTQAGYVVTTVDADSQSNPDAGVAATQRLFDVEKIPVLVGAVSSAVTIAIAEKVTIPNRILQISPASSAANISYLEADKDTDLLFRTNLSDALQGVRLAALAREKGYNKVSSLYVDNAYGQSIDRVFTESFGKESVVANVAHPDGSVNSSFTTELSWLAVNGSEALAAFSYPHQIDIYVKEAIDYGFFKNFLFASGGKSKNLVTLVGAEALEGMCGTQPGLAQSDSLELFKANYQKKFGEIPSLFPYAAATYDAIVSATLAAYAAEVARETVTGTTIRNHLRKVAGPDGERVVAGLDSLKRAKSLLDQGKDINYLGASGEVDYDAVGDVARPVDVWCYQNGEMVVQP